MFSDLKERFMQILFPLLFPLHQTRQQAAVEKHKRAE